MKGDDNTLWLGLSVKGFHLINEGKALIGALDGLSDMVE